jgi:hypothetical protein
MVALENRNLSTQRKSSANENKSRKSGAALEKKRLMAHIGFGIFVGAGIDQQPRTVRVTPLSGTHQRRPSVLRVEFASASQRSQKMGKL